MDTYSFYLFTCCLHHLSVFVFVSKYFKSEPSFVFGFCKQVYSSDTRVG